MNYKDKLTLEDMISLKESHHISCDKIAKETSIPLPTVRKIFGGVTKTPRYETYCALETYFLRLEGNLSAQNRASIVKETDTYGHNQHLEASRKEWHTVSEYELLPADRRVELIDGVFYDMAAPTVIHQILSMKVAFLLNAYIEKKKGSCLTLCAPIDVQLDKDDYTIVQPDIIVVCDSQKFQNMKRIIGAPDLIIEIISESSRKRDFGSKAHKYIEAGVREYWIIDTENEKIYVYDIEHGPVIHMYSFEDDIPVLIYGGDCVISFSTLKKAVSVLTPPLQ